MNPLAVNAYFDIGRGDWGALARSREKYVAYHRQATLQGLVSTVFTVGTTMLMSG